METLPNIYKNKMVGKRTLYFGIFMFVVFLICAIFILLGKENYRTESIVLGALWVIGVPIYLFFEHVFLFRKYGDPSQYNQFRRVQDLATKIWAAAVIVMAAFFAESFPH